VVAVVVVLLEAAAVQVQRAGPQEQAERRQQGVPDRAVAEAPHAEPPEGAVPLWWIRSPSRPGKLLLRRHLKTQRAMVVLS
jgi:hypothetical protein